MALTFSPTLTKEEVNLYPLFKYSGEIVLVQEEEELPPALERLREEPFLGFDTETKPSFRKGTSYSPSLLQLAAEKTVYIFQLTRLALDARLTAILSNPACVKAGVGIAEDMRSLRALCDFQPGCLVDLSDLARSHKIGMRSLRGLAACFLNVRISKSERCSNWGAERLHPRQIVYAATDAWISRQIYMRARALGLADELPGKERKSG
ncbi:MAG: 3'-5' exonuclease domain-containing protein 2 [Deltaproteobacteria bacterium]|jgi:ribonuclease D|nr:3'-5' exonuclease domain-containing protein 2 [Deltaproteobacteria bacterium]